MEQKPPFEKQENSNEPPKTSGARPVFKPRDPNAPAPPPRTGGDAPRTGYQGNNPRPFTPGGGGQGGGSRPFTPGGGPNRPYTPGGGQGGPRPFTPGSGPTGPRPFTPGGGGARPFGQGPRPPRGKFIPREERLEHRINEMIRITEGRLVGDNLEEIGTEVGTTIEPGIFSIALLREWAEKVQLDLVEVVPNAEPPVVRIIDYNKFVYNKKKKDKELKANAAKTILKEIRFGPNTDDHDFEFKTRHAREFLAEGAKVKAYVQFKGRAIVYKERGELLLLKFMKELDDLGSADQLPKLEGRRMMVILTPKKGGKK